MKGFAVKASLVKGEKTVGINWSKDNGLINGGSIVKGIFLDCYRQQQLPQVYRNHKLYHLENLLMYVTVITVIII